MITLWMFVAVILALAIPVCLLTTGAWCLLAACLSITALLGVGAASRVPGVREV